MPIPDHRDYLKHNTPQAPKPEWKVGDPMRGLGDVVATATHYTGIKAVVETVAAAVGKPCNCGGRQDALNKAIPFNRG